jgi:hypothetical protein
VGIRYITPMNPASWSSRWSIATPKAHTSQTNACCERVNRTLKEDFPSVAQRNSPYGSVKSLQGDLECDPARVGYVTGKIPGGFESEPGIVLGH